MTTVGTAAPQQSAVKEQTAKVEASFSDVQPEESKLRRRRPLIEDYVFYAEAQRNTDRIADGNTKHGYIDRIQQAASDLIPASPETILATDVDGQTAGLSHIETDRINAWRALRQSTWAGAFYLCTSDILGPFNAPYAFRQNGYVPGTLLYVFMGIAAFYCGALLWWLYVKLDSDRFPVKSYSDITERLVGKVMRVFVTWLVFIHMIVNIATNSLSSAQSLYLLSRGNLCFIVAVVIWISLGCILNQIRTLKRYSWLTAVGMWTNILIIVLSMGFVAHSLPNYAAAKAAYGIPKGPTVTQAFATFPLYERVNGVMNIAYAYGGATIFPQIIAEMRRPMDFLKAFSISQTIIFTIYIVYGLFIYSFQGQYTLPVAFQGVSRYSWQTVGVVLQLISGLIAGGLYGNIGLKIFYVNVVERFLKGPPLLSTRGRIYWTFVVLVFWWTGFVVGAAIPQVQTLSSMIAAVANMQFTYSFPTGFTFIYLVQLDATAEDGLYGPGAPPERIDTWTSWSRWKRGLFGARGQTWVQVFKWVNLLISVTALATAGLGIYGSGLSIAAAFRNASATSFGCRAPV